MRSETVWWYACIGVIALVWLSLLARPAQVEWPPLPLRPIEQWQVVGAQWLHAQPMRWSPPILEVGRRHQWVHAEPVRVTPVFSRDAAVLAGR